jgi:hypothetical protein
MWYDLEAEDWIRDEKELYNTLYMIADDNREYFDIDDLIDDMYRPFEMFGVKFYPCEIIKKMDEMLYDQIREDILSSWVEDAIYQLERSEPEVGDTMGELLLESHMSGLEMIVWKETD